MSTVFDESTPALAPAHSPFESPEPSAPAASPVRAALTASSGISAVNVAKARMLADTLGMPEGVALSDPAGAQREYDAFMLESNKRLAEWAAQTPDNAAIAKAEPKALGSLFDAAAEIPRFFSREAAALGSSWDKGTLQVRYSALGERYRAGDDSVLSEIEAVRQKMADAEALKSGTMANTLGLATATEQLPLQLNMTVPSATEAFGMGAAVWGGTTLATGGTGALFGSVVPGAGTLAGGATGAIGVQPAAVAAGMAAAKTTYLFRQAQRSFSMERGAFIADIALEKDVNGQPLPRGVQNAAADVYGLMAAAVETGGEAIFLKLLKPLGGQAIAEKFGEEGLKGFIKSAVKRAAFDQSTRGVLMDMSARIGLHSLAEGLEESVQEVASILAESVAKSYAEGRDGQVYLDTAILTTDNVKRVGESFTGGLAAGAWLGGGPIIVSGAFDVRSAQQAQTFARGHSDLHEKVEATEIKQLSPSHTQEILEAADPSLQEAVRLPADALLELYQEGTDLLSPLGLSEEQVSKAAGMGHSFEVPVSRMHANLDQAQFDAAAQIMRRSPDSYSAKEADGIDGKITADAEKVATLYQEQASELAGLASERERVRQEAIAAVEAVPGLKAQAESMAGGVENYVDQWVTTLDAFARRMAPQGENIAETFRRMAVGSLNGKGGKELFHGDSSDPRGSVSIHSESYLVNLFPKADLSTLLHETGHVFFEEIERVLDMGIADSDLSADYATLREWVGARDGEALTTEQKEQIARGFEAYLMEGNAPSYGLQQAFSRFRRWLLAIYKSVKRLQVELSDEVRGAFDRMLATEQEVAASSARNELIDLTRKELDALGLTGAERTYASGLMAAARTSAAERLQIDRDRQRKRRLAEYTLEAREELRTDPVYIARSNMRKSPLDIDAVRNDFGEDVVKNIMRRVPASLEKDGVDPQIFAAEHGFENGADMIKAILDSKSMRAAIAEKVNNKEVAHDTSFVADDYLTETDQAQEQVSLVGKYLAANQGQEHLRQQAFARIAEQELAAMPMRQAVQTGNFLAAMRRALRQERQAIGAGDFSAALEANHKARLNMEFTRRSKGISRGQQSAQRQMARFVKMTKADPDARFIVMDIAMRHGLGKFNASLAEGRDGGNVQAWLRGAEAGGYTLFVDDAILYGPGKPWQEMSGSEFENLAETVAQIVTVERNSRQLLTAQGKADLDEVASSIADEIGRHRESKALKTVERDPAALKLVSGVHAIHTKIEALCIALDGDRHGPAWEYVYRPIAEADDNQGMRFKAARDSLRKMFGVYSRKELATIGHKKVFVKEIGESLTHENRLALALNMGNATNISRIKEGHGWDDNQIAAALHSLTKKDWEFVQSIWDYLETFREESFALQEAVTGMRPKAVVPQPLTVQTAEGQTLNLRGGYYPIRYNYEKGFRAFQQEQAAMDKELFGGRNYGAAQTKQGHLKERAKGGQKSPLLLELTVPVDHVFNVIHDLAFRRAVLDVAKVIRHGTVRQAIEGTVGKALYQELLPWLQDVANERQEPMHYIHRMARWARASISIMQMGWKFTTMFTQPIGYTQTAEMLGYKWAGQGLKMVYGNPLKLPALIEETFAKSAMMATRIKSFDREVREITKRLTTGTGLFGWVDKVRESAFVPMGVFQMGVDLPTWWGAYAKGLQSYSGDEIKARQYADSIVRMSQGSGSTKDLARVQRGGDLQRMATIFYSYFNTFYNLAARRFTDLKRDHSPAAIFRAANTALLLWFIPAVLSELVAGRGPGSGDDEDEDVMAWAGMNILQYPWQAIVGVRDIANGVFGEFGYQITPAQSAPNSFVKWSKSVHKALEGGDASKLVKPTVEALGYAYSLPLKQAIITVGNVWDYLTGDDPEFEVRDLFFVKPKHRR